MTLATLRILSVAPYDLRRTVVVAGSPRSGTTWVARILNAAPGSSILFEPLHLDRVPAARRAGYSWRTYIRPGDSWPEGERFMKQALEGRVLNSWTIREVEHVRRTRVWIVKFIRANRMLGWIAQTFPVRPPVLVLRHPCAVVASQIAYGFPRPGPPDDPRLLADHPAFADIIASLQTDEELRTAHWCLDTVVPLSLPKPHPWHVIVFEALASRGIGEIEQIFRLWRLDTPPDLDRRMAEWSSTARNQSSRSRAETLTEWRKLLRPDQIRRVLEVVQAFGIDFYGDDPQPDEERLVNWSPLSHS